ncbi:TIGR00341 family protein [Spartinivicinus poritis]|uniref:TIGR00341 family protein n=1 Tax=Spartinivicinus poritis TaxID=2994640 RepID=A0ABT5U895_9GAMM|nr:TIGR00341 family protein [Spartinivicinus sp. A2-2]MDE1462593.1 TIGR00341 family protein [Spartinivicinus sp. A2-2]
MGLRIIELLLPEGCEDKITSITETLPIIDNWQGPPQTKRQCFRFLVTTEQTEAICDAIQKHFAGFERFRMIILRADASLPLAETHQPKSPGPKSFWHYFKPEGKERVSREEIYHDIAKGCQLNWMFIANVVLSALVAAIGLMRNDVAIIIGAMVIAPLLKPNVAIALGVILHEGGLALRALLTNLSGMLIGLVIAILIGLTMEIDPTIPEISARTHVALANVLLALAAGMAGALSFTSGAASTLIGVMVAVALMPPLVTIGLMIGSGHWLEAMGAAVLFLANIIAVNLSALLAFKWQGLHPRHWWHHEAAWKNLKASVVFWVMLLLAICALIGLWLGKMN